MKDLWPTATNLIKPKNAIFITGPAGTGKTSLLNSYIKQTKEQGLNVAITSSTAITAKHIGGVTIHKYLGLGISNDILEYKEHLKKVPKNKTKEVINNILKHPILIIDEVSMLSSKFIDLIDYVLKEAAGCQSPFGGIKVIFSGDLLQLSPVAKNKIDKKPPYESKAWKEGVDSTLLLNKVKRQDDSEYIEMLNEVRQGENIKKIYEYFKNNMIIDYKNYDEYDDYIRICGTNAEVEKWNKERLSKLEGNKFTFTSEAVNEEGKQLSNQIELKVGARVMTTINDRNNQFFNGSIGTIKSIGKDEIQIQIDGENGIIKIHRVSMLITDDKNETFKINQFPIKLAYAITVHKSQGLTLDRVLIDCAQINQDGQLYTAMSRCSKSKNLLLENFDPEKNILTNDEIKLFYKKLNRH